MDGSRVTQSLDSLWFYTNILNYTHEPLASLTDQFSPLVHAKELPKTDLQKPNTPFLLNQQQQESLGEISLAFEEVRVMPEDSEMVKSAGRETEKRERRKRRKWNKLGPNGTKVIVGGLDVREVGGFLKFQEESFKYQMLITQKQTKLPPFDDDVAMKQHLKSWAYAVACTVK